MTHVWDKVKAEWNQAKGIYSLITLGEVETSYVEYFHLVGAIAFDTWSGDYGILFTNFPRFDYGPAVFVVKRRNFAIPRLILFKLSQIHINNWNFTLKITSNDMKVWVSFKDVWLVNPFAGIRSTVFCMTWISPKTPHVHTLTWLSEELFSICFSCPRPIFSCAHFHPMWVINTYIPFASEWKILWN